MCQRKYVQKLSEQRKTRKLFETLTFLEKQMENSCPFGMLTRYLQIF